MNAELTMENREQEARQQVERDLRTQLSRERSNCVGCAKQCNVTLDGRCLACYCQRTTAIFGVCPVFVLQ